MKKHNIVPFIGTQMIINESDIDDVFESIYRTIISNVQKSPGQGSSWIIDSVILHNINISKYNPLACSSYIKLPKELDYPRNSLTNVQNINDNKCFKWRLVMYLHPEDRNPGRTAKADRDFAKCLDFKDTKFPVKTRDIHKIWKKEFNWN